MTDLARLLRRLGRLTRHEQVILFILAVIIGVLGGASAIVFRESIAFVQFFGLGTASERMHFVVSALPWWRILLVTTGGGLAVGLIVRYLMPSGRPEGVADVIAASALRSGRMSLRNGLGAAVVSAV